MKRKKRTKEKERKETEKKRNKEKNEKAKEKKKHKLNRKDKNRGLEEKGILAEYSYKNTVAFRVDPAINSSDANIALQTAGSFILCL